QIGRTDGHRNARRVLRWIAAHGKQEVSCEDIRRDALGQSLDAEQTQELIDDLAERWGWLKEDTIRTGAAGRPRRRWRVTPKLFSKGTAGISGIAETPANHTADATPTNTARVFRNSCN